MNTISGRTGLRVTAALCALVVGAMGPAAMAQPLYPSSVASNDLDFIQTGDPHVYSCARYLGERRQEMPGHPSGELFANGVFTFEALFQDGASVEVWVHYDVGTNDRAAQLIADLGPRLGRLPTFMRDPLQHVVIHAGDGGAFAESEAQFFVLYADNMATRIANNDLNETVFHESVHATLDSQFLNSRAWQSAQRADPSFVTQYAESRPNKEDMAESALFAYALTLHPSRLPAAVEAGVRNVMPNRLAFFEELFSQTPTFYTVGSAPDC